jgi:20S proteasome subunit beta 1
MTREEAVDFAKSAVSLAMSRDGSSGGIVRMAIITEAGVERENVTADNLPFQF